MEVPLWKDLVDRGEKPEYLLWVGCACAYDLSAQKMIRSLVKLLNIAGVTFGILGDEEQCTGDPARRAGNEFVFQMLALQNIELLNSYGVERILCVCPHCYNVLKNEYPDLGGTYEVVHYSTLLSELIRQGRLSIGAKSKERITYHDSCYLGRGNGEYEAPREVVRALYEELTEMERSRERGLCCGAGGAQMFKEEETGTKRVSRQRTEEIIATGAKIVALNCPYCKIMLSDGLNTADADTQVKLYDLSELILQHLDE